MKDIFPVPTNAANDWITLLKANDDDLLKSLYAAGYPGTEKYVLNNNGSEDDARDVYQEAFIVMWRNVQLDKVAFSGIEQLQGYVFRIAQYKWLDQLRSSRVRKTNALTESEIPEGLTGESDKQEEEYILKIKTHYAAMADPCREVLNRFYYLKQSMAEIASFFSWTEATAKNNKYRCLQKLRNMILAKNNSI
jgi:RNA polymerase sigma factor (sigma-70 family)